MPWPCRGMSVSPLPSVVIPATRENILSVLVTGDSRVNTLVKYS